MFSKDLNWVYSYFPTCDIQKRKCCRKNMRPSALTAISYRYFKGLMKKEMPPFCYHKSNSLECMDESKNTPPPTPPPPLWFGGSIVTQALSPIDTSGYIPGGGQICCRIKLIYQMIEYESKATLLENMQKALTPPVAMIHEWLGSPARRVCLRERAFRSALSSLTGWAHLKVISLRT